MRRLEDHPVVKALRGSRKLGLVDGLRRLTLQEQHVVRDGSGRHRRLQRNGVRLSGLGVVSDVRRDGKAAAVRREQLALHVLRQLVQDSLAVGAGLRGVVAVGHEHGAVRLHDGEAEVPAPPTEEGSRLHVVVPARHLLEQPGDSLRVRRRHLRRRHVRRVVGVQDAAALGVGLLDRHGTADDDVTVGFPGTVVPLEVDLRDALLVDLLDELAEVDRQVVGVNRAALRQVSLVVAQVCQQHRFGRGAVQLRHEHAALVPAAHVPVLCPRDDPVRRVRAHAADHRRPQVLHVVAAGPLQDDALPRLRRVVARGVHVNLVDAIRSPEHDEPVVFQCPDKPGEGPEKNHRQRSPRLHRGGREGGGSFVNEVQIL
eukprot:Rhum_TRINITY_DN14752_c1_g1::Rhum_TRINITY_DN14752_c1_g1_i1::g.115522::m.115522